MKIFSLESKISLVGWAIVLGFIVNILVAIFFTYKRNCWFTDWPGQPCYGFPIALNGSYFNNGSIAPFLIDSVFWVLVVLVILSLVLHFRKRNLQTTSNV